MAALKYATELQLAAILGIKKQIPSWAPGSTPSRETVGTGDNSQTEWYLDQQNVISGSYTLSHGASEASLTTLTETTHYTLDKDTGKITLTAGGVTQVGTDIIYAEYHYYSFDVDPSDMDATLQRAEALVDSTLNTTFTDGTATNPAYPAITREKHPTKGSYDRNYFSKERPIINVTATLGADLTAGANTLQMQSGEADLFPTTGYVVIGTEVIQYSGVSANQNLTGLTRGVFGSTAAAHDEDDEVHTTIVEVSGSTQGETPTWYVQEVNNSVDVEDDLGKIYIYESQLTSDATASDDLLLGTPDVPNRLRITYLHGFNTVPADITRLALLYAKRMLLTDTIGASLFKGRDEFRPELADVDLQEIKRIEASYRQLAMGNT